MDGLATRALIVAGQALSRIGLASLLKLETQFIEIMEASSLEGLVGVMTASVDLLVIDSELFNWGLPFLRSIKSASPQAKFILLTEDGDREAVIEALSSGADGVIPKSSSGDEIRFALKRVLGGDVYVPPSIASPESCSREQPFARRIQQKALTDRQWEVMRYVCVGYSNKEVARELGISEGTAKVHVRRSFQKLGVENRFAAAKLLRAHL
jgi:two-component system nitrate/nitrite response regulator NarL